MLHELQLKNFRCFDSLALDLAPGFNFFVGANGEGKTSILEAACVLLRLQSQRTSSLAPLIQIGAKAFSVAGTYADHSLQLRYGGLRRRIEFDGIEQRNTSEYLRTGRVVSLANSDIEIVRGSSEGRRRYLDFLGSQIDLRYRPALRAFERALRSRNALLKSGLARPREIHAYDQPLVQHGTVLSNLRADIIRRLAPFVAATHRDITKTQESADIHFSAGNGADFAADLMRTREKELRLRQTVVGPHRDDIELDVDGVSAQLYGSEGQQRTLALALKIAQARLFTAEGDKPLLLIDDIFGELDPNRKDLFLRVVPADLQKLVTATSRLWPRDLSGPVMELRDRMIRVDQA